MPCRNESVNILTVDIANPFTLGGPFFYAIDFSLLHEKGDVYRLFFISLLVYQARNVISFAPLIQVLYVYYCLSL